MFKNIFKKKATFRICATEREVRFCGNGAYERKISYISTNLWNVLALLDDMDLVLLGYEVFCGDTRAHITVSGHRKDLEAFVSEFAHWANGAYTVTQI